MKFADIKENTITFSEWLHTEYGIGKKRYYSLPALYQNVLVNEYYNVMNRKEG